MNLSTSDWNDEDGRQTQYNCLEGFLSQTKELRCLSVTGDLDGNVFKNAMWPHLEILHMERLTLDPAQLKTLTQTHKDTLHTLLLCDVVLTEKGCFETAIEMGKYLRLRRLEIADIVSSCDQSGFRSRPLAYTGQKIWELARSFMQSVPQTKELGSRDHPIIIAFPGEGVPGEVHDDLFLSRIYQI